MLRQRIITAVILLIVVIAALVIGSWAFAALAAVAIGCTLWEWLKLADWNNIVAAICAVILAVVLYLIEIFNPSGLNFFSDPTNLFYLSVLGVVIWGIQSVVVVVKRVDGWVVPKFWMWLSAWLIVPSTWFFLMYIYRNLGAVFMISVLAIVWIADISAYFGGSSFGGPKMSPGISPKKTWSGAITAFLCTLLVAFVCFWTIPSAHLWSNAVISKFGPTISVVLISLAVLYSIIGDLFESALKRTAGIKDSSNLLPGHGGVFDRLDAQFAVFPLATLILLLI